MWAELFKAPNRYVAETWRELLYAEGVSVRLVASEEDGAGGGGAMSPVLLYVPDSKTHVAREILRKV